ncbi:hypothetical protein AgCh_031929 [Apium graveolens]
MSGFDDPPGRRNELRNIWGFDPTILSEKYMTEKDDNIRNIDFPKRLQLRNMIHLYRRIVETSELPIVKEDVMRFLDFIHIQKLDVSFIALYRKDECPSLFKDPEQLEADGLQNSYDKKPALMWHKCLMSKDNVIIEEVALVDGLKHNLLSISQLCDKGNSVTFNSEACVVTNKRSNKMVLTGVRKGNVYLADFNSSNAESVTCLLNKASQDDSWL